MFLNSMRIRLAMMATGIALSAAFFLFGGFSGGKNSSIQIEFGVAANEFIGCEVEIDGEVAGKLRMFGNATKTGFLVKPGMHEVAVIHPELDCEVRTVETTPGTPVMLILDFQERMNEEGESVTMLVFQ